MIKYKTITEIHLPRDNKAKCPIYEHNGKYYIKANKLNTGVYRPFMYDNVEYSEVHELNGYWFLYLNFGKENCKL